MADYVYNDSELQIDTTFILCIEELDPSNSQFLIDTRLFIGWDEEKCDFFVKGRRQDTKNNNFVPFAFHCESSNDLYDFIKFTMSSNNVNVILYNFNNTVYISNDELTYEFFERGMNKDYEISGYDDIRLTRPLIVKCLRMLRNTYNWENDKK